MEKNQQAAEQCVAYTCQTTTAIDQVNVSMLHITDLAASISTAASQQKQASIDITSNTYHIQLASEANWQQTDVVLSQMTQLETSIQEITNIAQTYIPSPKP